MIDVTPAWRIKMLFDGQCPLCSREAALQRRRDRDGKIVFEDITDPAFDPSRYGLTMPQLIGAMHAVRPDGTILRGIDVFAELYEIVGWTWLARPLRWKLTRPIAQLGYRIFAWIRPRLSTFRPTDCVNDRCQTKPDL